jgi:6-phosphogluconolactonase (cycloisomerase 2 family)
LISLVLASASKADLDRVGAVYTMSNQTDDNRVLAFDRRADGSLVPAGSFSTGGKGTGGGLGNQGAVLVSPGGRWLFVVNAGSDDISMFAVGPRRVRLVARVGSGGRRPVSLALHDELLYVVNAGGAVGGVDNIAGFRVHPLGSLLPIAGSVRPLSAPSTGPAEISFSPEGDFLVVTEKATNRILAFPVDDEGVAGAPIVNSSVGQEPFGFAFDPEGALLVSEAFGGAANASAVSSYDLGRDGELAVLDPSVATTKTAACWVVTTRNGRFAYVTDTGSATISGFSIGEDGDLTLLAANGISASTGGGPIDAAVTRDDRFLYELESGTPTIRGFRIGRDGALSQVGSNSGLPLGTNGLAVR